MGGASKAPRRPRSVHRPLLDFLLGGQAEAGLRLPALHDASGYILAHRRTVLEAVAGATAHQPHVLAFGMAVDQEIAVGRVLVLADLARHQRRVLEAGKAPRY